MHASCATSSSFPHARRRFISRRALDTDRTRIRKASRTSHEVSFPEKWRTWTETDSSPRRALPRVAAWKFRGALSNDGLGIHTVLAGSITHARVKLLSHVSDDVAYISLMMGRSCALVRRFRQHAVTDLDYCCFMRGFSWWKRKGSF